MLLLFTVYLLCLLLFCLFSRFGVGFVGSFVMLLGVLIFASFL